MRYVFNPDTASKDTRLYDRERKKRYLETPIEGIGIMELGELGIYLGIIFTRMFVYGDFFLHYDFGNFGVEFFWYFLLVIFLRI